MCSIHGYFAMQPGGLDAVIRSGANLNNRGHAQAGFAGFSANSDACHIGDGFVRDVCNPNRKAWRDFVNLVKRKQIHQWQAHTRYPTMGGDCIKNGQPLFGENETIGPFYVCHNGQLANPDALKGRLRNYRFTTSSDSEIIVGSITESEAPTLAKAMEELVRTVPGAFSCIAMSRHQMVGVRDRYGTWPLYCQVRDDAIQLASEPAGLPSSAPVQLLPRGSIGVAQRHNDALSWQIQDLGINAKEAACVFDGFYGGRLGAQFGSKINEDLRYMCGAALATCAPQHIIDKVDVWAAVPETGITALLGLTATLNIRPSLAAVEKNWYTVKAGRSYQAASQEERLARIEAKFAICRQIVEGKVIGLVDDTIVRSNTSLALTKMARAAGAAAVHWFVASPAIISTCHSGNDMQSFDELIANGQPDANAYVCSKIGADSVTYLPVPTLRSIVADLNASCCMGCLTGEYPEGLEPPTLPVITQ